MKHDSLLQSNGKDVFSFEKFEGATVVGLCGDCARPYIRKGLNRNLPMAIGALAFGLFMLLAIVTDNFGSGAKSSGNPLLYWALTIASLGGSVKFFLAYRAAMKQSGGDKPVTAEMIDADIVAKVLADIPQVSEGVILNWEALNAKRGATEADFSSPAFLAEIRAPFRAGTTGKILLNSFENADFFVVPGFYTDKSIIVGKGREEAKELIKHAIEAWQKETK